MRKLTVEERSNRAAEGKRLREELFRAGVSSADLARLFGVTRGQATHWTVGRRAIPPEVWLVLAQLDEDEEQDDDMTG